MGLPTSTLKKANKKKKVKLFQILSIMLQKVKKRKEEPFFL